MPNVAGAIDCTHIPLAAPSVNPEQYVNRKGNFTINTQLVVNHRGAITMLLLGGQVLFMTAVYLKRVICKGHWKIVCLANIF